MFAIVFAAALASSATQFDLVCIGNETVTSRQEGTKDNDYNQHFAFDLGRKIGYRAGAKASFDIIEVTSTEIILSRKSDQTSKDHSTIDRTTGTLLERYDTTYGFSIHRDAACTRLPYSGVLEPKF